MCVKPVSTEIANKSVLQTRWPLGNRVFLVLARKVNFIFHSNKEKQGKIALMLLLLFIFENQKIISDLCLRKKPCLRYWKSDEKVGNNWTELLRAFDLFTELAILTPWCLQ